MPSFQTLISSVTPAKIFEGNPGRRLPLALQSTRHSKLERAEEEIARLNIEVPRFATYIRDEDIYLRAKRKSSSHPPTLPSLIKSTFTGWSEVISMPII
jgi:hypothetical protein